MSDNQQPAKNHVTLLLLSVMLLGAALVFAVAADAPHTLVLTAAGLGLSFSRRTPLSRTTRSYVYAGVSVLAATVLQDQIFPVDTQRFYLIDGRYYAPAVIFLGIAITFFEQRDTTLTSVISLALIGTMIAGNSGATIVTNPRFPMTNGLLDYFHFFYGCVVAVQMLAMLAVLPHVDRRVRLPAPGRAWRWHRATVFWVSVFGVAGTVVGLRVAAIHYERLADRTFRDLFRVYMRRQSERMIFGYEVDLWRTVPPRTRADKTPVVRALAAQAPGYLRGRAFVRYGRGTWSSSDTGEHLPPTRPGGRYAYSVFRRALAGRTPSATPPPAPRPATIDLLPATAYPLGGLLAPGNAVEFELIADGLNNSNEGALVPREWDVAGGYSLALDDSIRDTAYQGPAEPPTEAERYLDIPGHIKEDVARVANTVFGATPPRPGTQGRLAQLSRFFEAGFTYELGVKFDPAGKDPILQFVEQRRGHCELFAATTVLLLRAQGIPARYVTGFVCGERPPSGTYWVARLEDAHAWTEAYVAEENRWVLVENTPASGFPTTDSASGVVSRAFDRLLVAWQNLLAQVKRGYVAEVIVALFLGLCRGLGRLLTHPLWGPVAVLSLGSAVWWLWQRRRRRRLAAADRLLVPTRTELQKTLGVLEKQARRFGVERQPCNTIRELARRLESAAQGPLRDALLELLREYETLRYQGTPPAVEAVAEFKAKVRRRLAAPG
ncbi:MAG: hypothetical protein A3K19_05645 [Lentisphaerae bacterium RIFOXYB12_FULL_65_16]|nr:MAG: hypothetical protein A3K18_23685 [Lentisphaerae bacterium RIFOXYA12_64_32]OGV94393.1 MAG: hypothetical protein A3K19_05645 [Lentisphaerae bacterium RIFOXYB12_FULL_65_16]